MTIDDVMNIKLDALVSYSIFKDVKFKGTDEFHVILEDSNGDTKTIYIELFQKYGNIN